VDYASGDSQLHVIVTGEGKTARPVAQFAVEDVLYKDGSRAYSITEIKTAGNTREFEDYSGLPAIQEYVQHLDKTYGGIRYVDQLGKLGMQKLVKGVRDPQLFDVQLEISNETIRLNNGSQYINKDDFDKLNRQAYKNVFDAYAQQRAKGGMIERQSTDNRRYL